MTSRHSATARMLATQGVAIHARIFQVTRETVWPVFDLLLRLWLAQSCFTSGVLKAMHWDQALQIARDTHPFLGMSAPGWAGLVIGLELGGALLLTLGLFTRTSALVLLLLCALGWAGGPSDTLLLKSALLGWYVCMGADRLSADHAFSGLASSALPLAAAVIRLAEHARRWLGPLYLLFLRLWLAVSVVAASLGPGALGGGLPTPLLPLGASPTLPAATALAAGTLLAAGGATRYLALLLWVEVSATAMMGSYEMAGFYFGLALFLLMLQGAGRWSLDALLEQRLKRVFPELEGKPSFALEGLPRVIIVGAGFGGLTCAAALRRTRVAVTLIDRTNHHLFQPLLYQVATASLSPGDIAAPIRPLFRDCFNTRVHLGTVTGVDTRAQCVQLGDKRLPYDYLVLATGATHGYFGQEGWATFAPGLKRIEDATEVRRRLLLAFEQAEATEDEAERRALLTFLIVGGGPTGVELAGAIVELARLGMQKDFRRFDPGAARVVLVQAGARLLPAFPAALSAVAQRSLEALGVEVRTQARVEHIDAHGVRISGEPIAAHTVLWAAGVVASPAGRWLEVPCDNAGRIKVGPDLSVPGLANVFAIGDTAASDAWHGQPVPGLAPAAKQGGAHVARVIQAQLAGHSAPRSFVYRHRGSLATIGRKSAVAHFGWLTLWGAPAWWLWGLVHVGLLVGMRNRVSTMVNWFWSYLTYRSAIRLITGSDTPPATQPPLELQRASRM